MEKIEDIRKKPEHIRLYFVWVCVIVCMFFILMLWFFSKKGQAPQTPIITPTSDIEKTLNNLEEQSKSIKDIMNTPRPKNAYPSNSTPN